MHDSIYRLYPQHILEQKSRANNLIVEILRMCEKNVMLCFKPGEQMKDVFFSVSDKGLYYLEKRNPSFSQPESKHSDYVFFWLLKVTFNNVKLLF